MDSLEIPPVSQSPWERKREREGGREWPKAEERERGERERERERGERERTRERERDREFRSR